MRLIVVPSIPSTLLLIVVQIQFSAFGVEDSKVHQTHSLKYQFQGSRDDSEAVLDGAWKVDGGGFREIFGGAGDLAHAIPEEDALGQHLVVKNEVVGVFKQRNLPQDVAGERAEACVILGKLRVAEQVLKGCERPIGDIFVEWHTAF